MMSLNAKYRYVNILLVSDRIEKPGIVPPFMDTADELELCTGILICGKMNFSFWLEILAACELDHFN